MKKILNIAFLLCFCLGIIACGTKDPNSRKSSMKRSDKKETGSAKKADDKPIIPTPPAHIEKAKAILAAVSAEDVAAVDGKRKFKILCTACHGMTGDLNVNGAKDLTVSTISMPERVAQVYHGKGLMTPFKGLMTDAEIVAVSKYIEELRK